jgi:outer membrane protein OmpA-like peptidoglycan-associated protein/MFS family permease
MHPPTPVPPPAAPTQSTVDINDSEDLSKIRAISLVGVGVVALFSYFFHIDYFPLFDLQAASSYLFAVTWVLAVLLIGLALIFLVPYAIIGMTLKTRKTPRGEQRLTAAIILWMGFGMLSLIGLSAGVLLAVWLEWHILWGLLMALVFILLLCGIGTHLYVKRIKKKYSSTIVSLWNKRIVRKLFISQLGIALLSGTLQLLPLMGLLLMFSRASGLAEDDYLTFFAVSMQCAMFSAFVGGMVLHVLFIPRHRKRWWIALCLMLALPWALSGVSRATGMLPMTMAQLTKIGNFRVEKLILSPAACVSIAPILGTDCDEKTSPPIQLCNVHIMSRIGPETYLRIADTNAGTDGKFPVRRIVIPTAQITSMQINFDIKNLRLALIDADLGGRSSACETTLTTLHGDSAFGFNDFTLTESGMTQLLSFIQEIKNGARAIEEIKVVGHSDQIGTAERNAWLSTRRAQEVKLFLDQHLKNIVPGIKVSTSSQASTQPLIKDCSALAGLKERIKCEAPNRRVELEIVRKAPVKPT